LTLRSAPEGLRPLRLLRMRGREAWVGRTHGMPPEVGQSERR